MPRVRALYEGRIAAGEIEWDEAQDRLVDRLDRLAVDLEEPGPAARNGGLGWFAPRRGGEANGPRGLYIYGPVGRGKTMLMDLFFESLGVARKRRSHFHAFMADVHARIHDWRRRSRLGEVRGDEPISPVAAQIAGETRVLCFDEFFVTDIADAMVLGRLFSRLFDLGVVLVATSNVGPSRLYEGGLNRALFMPFVKLLESRADVVELRARADFRLEKLGAIDVWLTPADARAKASLDKAFKSLTGRERGRPDAVVSFGREVVVPQAAENVARFDFSDLCERPLAAPDYVEIARRFHTVLIDSIPRMSEAQRNEARRFVWLIDALYDMRVKLIASAEDQPARLYAAERGIERFEFARAASRLMEMRSQDYLALPHGRESSEASGDATGLAET